MRIHLPTFLPADALPEDVRCAEFRDPSEKVAGFLVRMGRERVLRLPTDTYYTCPKVDVIMYNLWYLWAYGLMAAALLSAARVLLP